MRCNSRLACASLSLRPSMRNSSSGNSLSWRGISTQFTRSGSMVAKIRLAAAQKVSIWRLPSGPRQPGSIRIWMVSFFALPVVWTMMDIGWEGPGDCMPKGNKKGSLCSPCPYMQ
ncbi:hypothetical protein D3C78_1686540 [compost metagenome]